MNRWDIYWADMPYEENPSESKMRPVIIAKDKSVYVLVIRVTSKHARDCDPYDYELQKWKEAGLDRPSTVRVAKIAQIRPDRIGDSIGRLALVDIAALQSVMANYKRHRQRL